MGKISEQQYEDEEKITLPSVTHLIRLVKKIRRAKKKLRPIPVSINNLGQFELFASLTQKGKAEKKEPNIMHPGRQRFNKKGQLETSFSLTKEFKSVANMPFFKPSEYTPKQPITPQINAQPRATINDNCPITFIWYTKKDYEKSVELIKNNAQDNKALQKKQQIKPHKHHN